MTLPHSFLWMRVCAPVRHTTKLKSLAAKPEFSGICTPIEEVSTHHYSRPLRMGTNRSTVSILPIYDSRAADEQALPKTEEA